MSCFEIHIEVICNLVSTIICKVIKYARSFICSLYDISSFLPVFFALSANTSSNKMPLLNVIFTKSQCQVSNDLCHWRDLVQKPQYPRFFFGFQIISAYASKNVPHKEEIMKEKIKNKEKKWNKIAQEVNTQSALTQSRQSTKSVCMCVFVWRTLLLLFYRVGRMLALSPGCRIERADFTDSMSFFHSTPWRRLAFIKEALSANT